MRDYAEMVALEIRNTTELEAVVNEKMVPDGTVRYGVTIKTPGANIAPSIYVEGMKEQGLSVEEAAKAVLGLYETHKAPQVDVDWFTDYEQVKGKLFVKLLPKTFKTDVFRSAKAYGFEDLILVPYAKVEFSSEEKGSIKITADHIARWGVTKREVMDAAIRNTKNGNVKIVSLMGFMMGAVGCPEDEEPEYNVPIVISNQDMIFGASAILGKMEDIKAVNPDGFFVIPSSVHELIVLPKGEFDADSVTGMVHAVNTEVVVPEERLSDHVYVF